MERESFENRSDRAAVDQRENFVPSKGLSREERPEPAETTKIIGKQGKGGGVRGVGRICKGGEDEKGGEVRKGGVER